MRSSTVFKLSRWSLLLSFLLIGAAMALYPGGTGRDPSTRGYSFIQNSLSDLGSEVAWGGESNSPGAILFTAAFGIFALAAGASLAALVRVYASSPAARRAALAAAALGALSCAGLLGAALTPQDRHPSLHGQFTAQALWASVATALLLAVAAMRDQRFPRRGAIGWLALAGLMVAWMCAMQWRPATDLQFTFPVALQKAVAAAVAGMLFFQTREAERVADRTGA